MERSRRLDDDALAEEIELYGDLVVAASEAGDVMPQSDIDRLLGVASDDALVQATEDPSGEAHDEAAGDGSGGAPDDASGGAAGGGGAPGRDGSARSRGA